MNAPERIPLGDVQSLANHRNLPIDAVGVRGLRYPIVIKSGEAAAPTIATLSMAVALPAIARGTRRCLPGRSRELRIDTQPLCLCTHRADEPGSGTRAVAQGTAPASAAPMNEATG